MIEYYLPTTSEKIPNDTIHWFQERLLNWYSIHGRKLPWRSLITPYRVWVSEIMLQQTQVKTALPYFFRFMEKWPNLTALSEASENEVLHLWSGLGYYTRGRSLLKAAKIISSNYNGKFPDTYPALIELPGIGPSTAGAILSIAFQQPVPILDGNVKRVLARFLGILSPINEAKLEKQLYAIAKEFTPINFPNQYAQGIMDMGATLCKRNSPQCEICPLTTNCVAYNHKLDLPIRKKAAAKPKRYKQLLFISHQQNILLSHRLHKGVWQKLWSLPEFEADTDITTNLTTLLSTKCKEVITHSKVITHTFTHYQLIATVIFINVSKRPPTNPIASKWYDPNNENRIGIPAPIKQLITQWLQHNPKNKEQHDNLSSLMTQKESI